MRSWTSWVVIGLVLPKRNSCPFVGKYTNHMIWIAKHRGMAAEVSRRPPPGETHSSQSQAPAHCKVAAGPLIPSWNDIFEHCGIRVQELEGVVGRWFAIRKIYILLQKKICNLETTTITSRDTIIGVPSVTLSRNFTGLTTSFSAEILCKMWAVQGQDCWIYRLDCFFRTPSIQNGGYPCFKYIKKRLISAWKL